MNFTVKGATAYEEDKWDWIKIGNVILRNVRPCTRCIFTTIDPETGTKHPNTEPLKTLKRCTLKYIIVKYKISYYISVIMHNRNNFNDFDIYQGHNLSNFRKDLSHHLLFIEKLLIK